MRDPILAGLVTATSANSELEFPVVLLSGGLVIEGTLVSEGRWLDELAGMLEAGPGRAASFGRVFREAGAAVVMAAAVGDAGGGLVHLLGATIRSGAGLHGVGPWRLVLEAVDGWKLGRALPEAVRAG